MPRRQAAGPIVTVVVLAVAAVAAGAEEEDDVVVVQLPVRPSAAGRPAPLQLPGRFLTFQKIN